MKIIAITLGVILLATSYAHSRVPPRESQDACKRKSDGSSCSFVSPKGKETGTCAYTPDNKYYSCRPKRRGKRNTTADSEIKPEQKYSIEQATSDNAQLHTISFAALSFMSSEICEMSFLPPGKHASYFGFQHLRDVVGGAAGHEQNFVPNVANNMLYILSPQQRMILINLAKQQRDKIKQFALKRFPLLIAFERYGNKQLPQGTTRLNKSKIIQHSGDIYALDGELSYERAVGFGKVVSLLTQEQKNYLHQFKNKPYDSWPQRNEQMDKRQFEHSIHVALMTYASELFSWYVGDLKKDVYFTPERTAAYFGAYWTKAAPMKAVRRDNYRISTALTGDSGAKFLQILNRQQKSQITNLIQHQKPFLMKMSSVRELIATEIRKILRGEIANQDTIISLSRKFGELDGEIAYLYAIAYTNIRTSLSQSQLQKAIQIRNIAQYQCKGAFIYAEPSQIPNVENISSFFR
ncbi:MAG: hypothetical protein GY694_04920 [Gammaproteobacteria bacterium]|nr:hypothetical protein [Gammaproteobacteria bacterium]